MLKANWIDSEAKLGSQRCVGTVKPVIGFFLLETNFFIRDEANNQSLKRLHADKYLNDCR